MKKLLSLILSIVMLLSLCIPSFAVGDPEYQEYLQYVNAGVLGDDITFEYWKELKERSYRLETFLENSDDFTLVYDSNDPSTFANKYVMKKGDVLITNGTASAGILGHSGIATSGTRVFHIAGFNQVPEAIKLTDWHKEYTVDGWTKVYRHSSSTVANAAADWAVDTYEGSNAKYVLNMDLSTTHETYCSKLVWQAYYYGPSTHCANGPTTGFRLPYDLPETIHDLTHVHTDK